MELRRASLAFEEVRQDPSWDQSLREMTIHSFNKYLLHSYSVLHIVRIFRVLVELTTSPGSLDVNEEL